MWAIYFISTLTMSRSELMGHFNGSVLVTAAQNPPQDPGVQQSYSLYIAIYIVLGSTILPGKTLNIWPKLILTQR